MAKGSLPMPDEHPIESSASGMLLPPRVRTEKGAIRRLGVEIELAGLALPVIAKCVADIFGGEVKTITDYELRIRSERHGEFRVEVDSSFLKRIGQDGSSGLLEELGEAVAGVFAGNVVPLEICSPPLPMPDAALLDALGTALGRLSGEGTGDSLLYAFGIHFNPEAQSLSTSSILRHLQSFLLLHDWLITELGVDPSRRITGFISSFPVDYLDLVIDPDYTPDWGRFVEDYLEHNPTRNRALDLLPLLSHIDPDLVRKGASDVLINPRPTWHYRLVDSRIGEPNWKVTRDWWSWVLVERLADDTQRLAAWMLQYRDHAKPRWPVAGDRRWRARIAELVQDIRP